MFFGDLFGTGVGPVRGADQEAEVELTVEAAYKGGSHRITLPGPERPRSYDVNIPAGVTDGQRIRLAGQGGQGRSGPAGDLYLVVRTAPHPRFRLEGRDVYVDLLVSPWEAALGAEVAVEGPGGEMKVSVPGGSSSGRRLRLRHRGLPNPKGAAGDLYAELKIVLPRHLSPPGEGTVRGTGPRVGVRPPEAQVTTVLARPLTISLDDFSRATGLHPELVARLVRLGLIEAARGAAGALRFAPTELARARRALRLREGLSLNYAALGLVLDLLDRIDVLETALRQPQPPVTDRGTDGPQPLDPAQRRGSAGSPEPLPPASATPKWTENTSCSPCSTNLRAWCPAWSRRRAPTRGCAFGSRS